MASQRSDGSQPPVAARPPTQLYDIENPHSNDVLCGRGVTTNRHPGNEKFRALVALNKELYVTSTKRQKMSISRSIVEAVRSMTPPGRFLEKHVESGFYNDIGDKKAIEKTSQALRDGAASLRKQLSEDLGDPDFLSAVFDMDTKKDSNHTTSGPPIKDKPKLPSKPKKASTKSVTVKKGHRRTKSNPDPLSTARQMRLARQRPGDRVISGIPHMRVSSGSHPTSPLHGGSPFQYPPDPGRRNGSGRDHHYPDWDRSASFGDSPGGHISIPSPARIHPPIHPAAGGYPTFGRSNSFEACWAAQHERHPPPPPHGAVWGGHAPLLPCPSFPPRAPRRAMSPTSPPDYSHQPGLPPLSPCAAGRPWSPRGSPKTTRTFSPGHSAHSSPHTWRDVPMPYHHRSGPELAVPALRHHDPNAMRMSTSQPSSPHSLGSHSGMHPNGMHHGMLRRHTHHPNNARAPSPGLPPKDFAPPPSPSRPRPQSTERAVSERKVASPATVGKWEEKKDESPVASHLSAPKPTDVVIESGLDETRSDTAAKPAVEVILNVHAGQHRTERDTAEKPGRDESPAIDVSMSPLPYYDKDTVTVPESLMDISDDLLRLPIAPVGPGDGDGNNGKL